MMRKITRLVLLAIFGLGGVSCGNKWKMPEVKMPTMLQEEKPEAMVQKRIALVLKTRDEIEFYRQYVGLLEVARNVGWDDRRLLAEVVEYHWRVGEADDLARYSRLIETMHVARSTVVNVAAPRLEESDARALEVTTQLLRWAAPPDPRGVVDYSHFQPYLEARAARPPVRLVVWMYERDPAAALWQMAAAYGQTLPEGERHEVLMAEHVVSEILWQQQKGLLKPEQFNADAIKQLERLMQFKQWWVRSYVGTILARHPKLRTAEMIEALKRDGNPVVQAVVGKVR